MGALFLFNPVISANIDFSETAPRELLVKSLNRCEAIQDYTAIFSKVERINGRLAPEETILFKMRKPDDIYFKWIHPHGGRESLFGSRHNNKIVIHESGILGLITLKLNPRGDLAMKGQHHDISSAGICAMTKLVLRGLDVGLKYEAVTVKSRGIVDLNSRKVLVTEATFPETFQGQPYTVQKDESLWDIAKRFDQNMYVISYYNGEVKPDKVRTGQKIVIPRYYCQRTVAYFDTETTLLIKLENYDWHGNLYERYTFKDIQINVGLTDRDFDPDNPEYRF